MTDDHDRRWRLGDSSPEEAYGRVTNPERYRVVVDAAESLIDELSKAGAVVSEGSSDVEMPHWRGSELPTRRLTWPDGTTIVFMVTDFPGVVLDAGQDRWEAFPVCGCDACDESPDEVIAQLTEFVREVTPPG